MASRAPPLLEPYLHLPHETSLILLSGVLGSSTNWLVHRYLYTLLASQPPSSSFISSSSFRRQQDESLEEGGGGGGGAEEPQQQQHTSVVFVSFLRDYAFWRDGSRRLGLDLDVASKKGSFVFIDGLTSLFTPASDHRRKQSVVDSGKKVLLSATTDHFRQVLEDALSHAQALNPGTQTVLVIDQPDIFLATAGDTMSGQGLRGVILGLREKVHSCIITVSADEPLIAAQGTSLEQEHASLALSLAHDAHFVISLRMLETGTAKDVSGVLRITPGGDEEIADALVEDRELLYFIRGDGSVRVFERGQ
ncbi:hypothetical protein F5B22DRAFT_40177 [Xylaria bambusicola]|uniref:uncharacterized protein n=1 Tax=Xylaria bambusicola TaxID=326684 RepID=UPI0020084461|nr:uncharacterized protein F5B22DRAFT_40177 [Xylaria bambusicola]KAI0521148.1 hypothetical protein F5B22DRAFT_40177 [Xylaria bambusicola]